MVYIYILKHPVTNEIRYVGKTDNPKRRLRDHISCGKRGRRLPVSQWIGKLLSEGMVPIMEIIEEVSVEWEVREIHWISYYRDHDSKLLNLSEGGEGQTGFVSEWSTSKANVDRLAALHRGKIISEGTRELIRQANIGKKHSLSTRQQMSRSHRHRESNRRFYVMGEQLSIFSTSREVAEYLRVGISAVNSVLCGLNGSCRGHRIHRINCITQNTQQHDRDRDK